MPIRRCLAMRQVQHNVLAGQGVVHVGAVGPTISSISPTTGEYIGGDTITLTGTKLTGVTSVKFGTAAATNVTVVSDTSVTCKTPVHAASADTVSVSATNPSGTSTLTAAFSFVVSAPTITSVSPASGDLAGGTSVTLTGTHFTGATAVSLGGVALTGVAVVDDLTITGTTGAHAAGAVTASVTGPGGTGTKPTAYTYAASFDPASLALSGWWRADYASPPWVGTASAGGSGSVNLTQVAPITNPSTGAALNGHIPALFDATDVLNVGSSTLATLIGSADWSLAALVNVHAIASTSSDAAAYNSDGLIADNGGYWGMYLSKEGGTNRFQIYVYHGGSQTLPMPIAALDAWVFLQVKYVAATHILSARLNNGSWATLDTGGAVDSTGGAVLVGEGYSLSKFLNGQLAELLTSKTAISDANFDNLRTYVNAQYGLAI